MKKIDALKKLQLNKETIAGLDHNEMNKVRGGFDSFYMCQPPTIQCSAGYSCYCSGPCATWFNTCGNCTVTLQSEC